MPRSPSSDWRPRVLRALLRLAGALPLPVLHAAGSLVGRLTWAIHGRARRIAERNLALVTLPITQNGTQNRHELAHAALRETGKALFETARIWGAGPQAALRLVVATEGAERLEAAIAARRGVIVASPHLGCWEVLNHWVAHRCALAVLYRPPRQAWLEPLLREMRGGFGVQQIRAEGSGVRQLYRHLAVGGVVGILPDQKPRQGEGVFAPFFGIPAETMVLLPRLAARTGATVLFAFAERLPRGRGYRVHVVPAPDGIDAADPELACAALNAGVERCIALAPAQYQWTYKRFSARAERGVANPYA